jgi:glycosyltransferase involved in cell wall biosynthesis
MLTLGRLCRFKGVHVLLDAIAMLRDSAVKMPVLAIAGEGPERDFLANRVRERGLIPHVRFLGDMQAQDKAWLLANCLFLVHPSLGREGMPNSVLEAMSYGKPVVGTRIGGMTDLIHDGRGGLLTEPGDAAALAAAIRQMLESDRAGYSRDARDIARDHAWDRIAPQYLSLLESVGQLRPASERSDDPARASLETRRRKEPGAYRWQST